MNNDHTDKIFAQFKKEIIKWMIGLTVAKLIVTAVLFKLLH